MSEAAWTFHTIARIRNDYTTKFAVPRQSDLVPQVLSRVVFEPDYRSPEALRGLEEWSHLWLVWVFHEAQREGWSPTVRPPRLGGDRRVGVFATRSPFRANRMGLSCVRLVGVEGGDLVVAGADLMNGTPILDIKPYLPYADCRPDAVSGFTRGLPDRLLTVSFPPELLDKVPEESREGLLAVLSHDPRPAYHMDPGRTYAFEFGKAHLQFRVEGGTLYVMEAEVAHDAC